uniref:Uncharacterized protein n=1 Tax=Romanomermis culicivorax TaxID=13658 RepID=A0A915KQ01_ROMCU
MIQSSNKKILSHLPQILIEDGFHWEKSSASLKQNIAMLQYSICSLIKKTSFGELTIYAQINVLRITTKTDYTAQLRRLQAQTYSRISDALGNLELSTFTSRIFLRTSSANGKRFICHLLPLSPDEREKMKVDESTKKEKQTLEEHAKVKNKL